MKKQEINRKIIEYINDGIIAIDQNGIIIRVNEAACRLLDKTLEYGHHIDEYIKGSGILEVLENKNASYNNIFKINNKTLVVDRIPLTQGNDVVGAVSIFNDMTETMRLNKKISIDQEYIDFLNDVLYAFNERIVVVDENGFITMMSRAYKEFIKVESPEGKHVTDVIENTRLHIVLKTGQQEYGEIQEIMGHKVIALRMPIRKDGRVIGVVGKIMFKDIEDFNALNTKLSTLETELDFYKKALFDERSAKYSFENIIGESAVFQKSIEMSKKAALTNSNVLVYGESGTGKELIAHAIHNKSARAYGPFVKINCAAIPPDLLESELFGYSKGAFTGANKEGKKGKFELANKGTILLDEIGDMPLSMQAKLLRVIQEREVEPVGSTKTVKLDVRIIASTNKDLSQLVQSGDFREDLYYRLNVVSIQLPPLRDRQEDILLLSEYLLKKISNRLGRYVEKIHPGVINTFVKYSWPGNIRELENVIERAINLLSDGVIIKTEHLPQKLNYPAKTYKQLKNKKLKDILSTYERDILINTLDDNNWNKKKSAENLGISRVALYKKLQKYNIDY